MMAEERERAWETNQGVVHQRQAVAQTVYGARQSALLVAELSQIEARQPAAAGD